MKTFSLVWIFLLLVTLWSGDAIAKKEKETDEPTSRPSSEPTLSPSTAEPTIAPSTPEFNETSAVTFNPTSTPTKSPISPAPTSVPTIKTTITNKIKLPTLRIDVLLNDEEGASQSESELGAEMTAFVEEILENNSGVNTFDYVSLDFDVIHSSFRRRKLQSGLSIRIDGNVYYGSDPPTTQGLSFSLWSYFSVWGIQDLETYLRVIGLKSARVVAVSIAGEVVKPAEDTLAYNPGASLERPQAASEDPFSITLVASLAAGVLVMLAMSAYIFIHTRGKRVGRRRNASLMEPSNTKASFAPAAESPSQPQDTDDLSVDMSIYTTESTVVTASGRYNTRRLDKIIEMGHEHSESSEH